MRKYLVSLLLCTLLISCASHKQYQSPEIRKEEVKTEKNKEEDSFIDPYIPFIGSILIGILFIPFID